MLWWDLHCRSESILDQVKKRGGGGGGGGGGGRRYIKLSSYQYGEPHVKDKTVFILRQGPAYFRHTYVDLWYSLYEPHMNTRQRIVVSKTLAILSIVDAFETGIIKIAVNMKRGLGIYSFNLEIKCLNMFFGNSYTGTIGKGVIQLECTLCPISMTRKLASLTGLNVGWSAAIC